MHVSCIYTGVHSQRLCRQVYLLGGAAMSPLLTIHAMLLSCKCCVAERTHNQHQQARDSDLYMLLTSFISSTQLCTQQQTETMPVSLSPFVLLTSSLTTALGYRKQVQGGYPVADDMFPATGCCESSPAACTPTDAPPLDVITRPRVRHARTPPARH